MPTPSVAFNLTWAFNPGSAKLLFNVKEHGVFRVTCEKCISNMQSKSDPVLFFLRVKEQSNTTAKRSETNMLFWHICHLGGLRRTPPAGSDDVCVCGCAMVWLIACLLSRVCCVYFQCNIHADHQCMALHRKTCWLVCHICTVCVLFHVWIHGQCQVLLCLEHLWMTGVCRPLWPC